LKGSLSPKSFSSVYNNSHIIKTHKLLYRLALNREVGIGFALSRRLGPASKRNLLKRRLRSVYLPFLIKKNFGVIIVPKTINLSWFEIKESFEVFLKKINDI